MTNESNKKSAKEENVDNFIYFPRIIAGPLSSIKKRTDNYVRLKPQKSSKIKGGKLADKIKIILISKTKEELKKWAKLIEQKDIIQFVPPGGSSISK